NIKPVQVYRGEFLESTHDVHIAIVNNSGELLYSYGNPLRNTFPRSALKPFQAIPLFERGVVDKYNFNKADVSICCASHNGEDRHRKQVMNILSKINLDESHLKCGSHPPKSEEMYRNLIQNNEKITQVFNNCSGKHAGMLGGCLTSNEDIESYYELSHPLQKEIVNILFNVCDIKNNSIETGVDGCGLPAHQFPLDKLAQGFSNLASPNFMSDDTYSNSLKKIRDSMMTHPEMVGGYNSFDTDIMNSFPGSIVSKAGAEGVQGIGLIDSGIGIAIKVEDGNKRGASIVDMEVLKELNIINNQCYEQMYDYCRPDIFSISGLKVGKIITDFKLKNNKHTL